MADTLYRIERVGRQPNILTTDAQTAEFWSTRGATVKAVSRR
jgi:hypothetical protein